MARHVLWTALVLWLSGQHLNRSCNTGEAKSAQASRNGQPYEMQGFATGLAIHSTNKSFLTDNFVLCAAKSMQAYIRKLSWARS
jgi:hypothetical protein